MTHRSKPAGHWNDSASSPTGSRFCSTVSASSGAPIPAHGWWYPSIAFRRRSPLSLRTPKASVRRARPSPRWFDLIEASGLVSADNLRFLTVDRLAALGRWQELADLPWFRDLSRTRRPRRITEHLLESLWRTHMESADAVLGPADALGRF